MSNLDALVQLRPQPDVDGPGFFSDGDMLQVRLQIRRHSGLYTPCDNC